MRTETTVLSGDARRCFERLCAHLRASHDLRIDRQGGRAEIVLPDGWCAVRIVDGGLHLVVKAWDHGALEPMMAFFTRHLRRFAPQAGAMIVWSHPLANGAALEDIPAAKLRRLAATLDQAARLSEQG